MKYLNSTSVSPHCTAYTHTLTHKFDGGVWWVCVIDNLLQYDTFSFLYFYIILNHRSISSILNRCTFVLLYLSRFDSIRQIHTARCSNRNQLADFMFRFHHARTSSHSDFRNIITIIMCIEVEIMIVILAILFINRQDWNVLTYRGDGFDIHWHSTSGIILSERKSLVSSFRKKKEKNNLRWNWFESLNWFVINDKNIIRISSWFHLCSHTFS